MEFKDIVGLRLDENGMIAIPEHIKRIKFDIGLSWNAPNSAVWLSRDVNKELFIIGIEPNRFACERLGKRAYHTFEPFEEAILTDDNYMLLQCAIDNVEGVVMKNFYHIAVDQGSSSLLKPTPKLKERHNLDVGEISEVPVIPLSMVLERIPWDRFKFIEHIKTDCQGKDMEVILSADDYTKKIVYLDCEVSTSGYYENELDSDTIVRTIVSKGFKILSGGINTSFLNVELEHLVKINNLDNYTTKE